MLMEIAAANAIWKTLSTALKNGQELYQLGTQLGDYLTATQKVKDKAGDSSSKGSALEAFQYQENLRKQREQLEYHLKKSRLNGWSDFVKFEAQWHRQRREEEQKKVNERIRRNAKLQKDLELATNIGICMILAMGLLFGIAVYIKGNIMSNMSDYDAGRFVTLVETLTTQVESLNETTVILSNRINDLEKQLVKGKGFLAGAMLLSIGLGGVGTSVLSKWMGT